MTRRKDGRWQQSVKLPGIDKPKVFYGKTKNEVLEKINAWQQEKEKGMLLSEVADLWESEHVSGVRYKTAEGYRAPLKDILLFFNGRRLKSIQQTEVRRFILDIESKGYARRTVQLRLDVLSMIFDYGIVYLKERLDNPCDGVKLSSDLPVSSRELPTKEDICAAREHKDDSRIAYLPFFLCYTGLRLGEALALTDESFKDGYIIVEKQVSWRPNSPVLAPPKTKRGVRKVPLFDVVKNSLPQFTGFLFSDDGKKPITKSSFRKRWIAHASKAGISCDCHSFRHEFATLMYDAGVDSKEAAEILGDTEETVRKIYTHIRESRRISTAHRLNDYLNEQSKQAI